MSIHLKLKILGLYVLLASSHILAEADPADTAPARYTAGTLDAAGQLARQLEADAELISLSVEDSSFFLIFRPAVAPVPVGNLLIVPDAGAATDWAEQGTAMARYLAEHGWNTLILQPPALPASEIPPRTLPSMRTIRAGAASPGTATDTVTPNPTDLPAAAADSPPRPFAEQVRERLSLARTELEQRGHPDTYINVILGIGTSATWAAALVAELGNKTDLVMINPRTSTTAEISLTELLPRIEGHIIDLFYLPLPGYPEAAPDARLRRQLATRHEMRDYHQSRLPGVFKGWQFDMPQLVRQLRGIMERTLPAVREEPAPAQAPATQAPPGQRMPRPAQGPVAS